MLVLDTKETISASAAIVFSASLDSRNYLRKQVVAFGSNAVCFENEVICFDNLKSIKPSFVIAETDSAEVVWRFVFALHACQIKAPLIIVSKTLESCWNTISRWGIPVSVVSMNQIVNGTLKKLASETDTKVDAEEPPLGDIPIFVGQSDPIKKIRAMLPSIIEARDPVLVTGETGTGKELLARLIVAMSKDEKTFIKIDCRELKPDFLVNKWLVAALNDGVIAKPATIFLDHVDQMPPMSQAEMRLLIETSRKSLNGVRLKNRNNIRFVASSEKNIARLVKQGAFRKDLFYRLNVIPVKMPSLRQRRQDIPLLMDHFIINACIRLKKCIKIPSRQAREMIYMHNWPGNAKELSEQMFRMAESGSEKGLFANTRMPQMGKNTSEYILNVLGTEELPKPSEIKNYLPSISNMSLKGICDEFVVRTERRLMKRALESTNWNRRKAARLLNISYKSMLNKIKAYGI